VSIEAGAGVVEDLGLLAPDVSPARCEDHELVADMREAQSVQAQMYAWDLESVARWAARRRTGWEPDPEPDPPWLDEQAPPDPLRR
jgi:hypothetical protein